MRPTAKSTDFTKKKELWKVFRKHRKELFAYTVRGEGEDEEEATISLLAYENHCKKSDIYRSIIFLTEPGTSYRRIFCKPYLLCEVRP